jgi:hypothetical protein
MQFEPQAEHQWLQQFVGEWTFQGECDMGPDQPKHHSVGVDTVYALGEAWIICQGQSDAPGSEPGDAPVSSRITLGYDPTKKKFVGNFVASCMPQLWIYEGTLDESKRILTLDTKGPNFSGPGLLDYQDIFEIVSEDHRVLKSRMKMEDGTWVEFMRADYRRVK